MESNSKRKYSKSLNIILEASKFSVILSSLNNSDGKKTIESQKIMIQ